MKKERQIGVRVGLPVFFVMELEGVYKHADGAHRALAFPDFLGFLIGLGLEQYRRRYIRREEQIPEMSGAPDGDDEGEPDQISRFRALTPAKGKGYGNRIIEPAADYFFDPPVTNNR
jgi:hypothetical protein